MRCTIGTIDSRTPAGIAATLLLVAALSVPTNAQDKKSAPPRHIVSPPYDVQEPMPAPNHCGTATVSRGDGTTIQVPRQGWFTKRCVTVTIVDGFNAVLSASPRCDRPVFTRC
jgi:hypothetical protein